MLHVLYTGVVTDSVVEGVILEPREIARRYVTSWFALDLVSSLPVDYIIVLVSPNTGVTQLVHAGQYHDDDNGPRFTFLYAPLLPCGTPQPTVE